MRASVGTYLPYGRGHDFCTHCEGGSLLSGAAASLSPTEAPSLRGGKMCYIGFHNSVIHSFFLSFIHRVTLSRRYMFFLFAGCSGG